MRLAILTDIEGTTSSIAFVRDVLFPHSRRALPALIGSRDPLVRPWLDAVARELDGADYQAVVGALLEWIDEDRKHPALKALQGVVWEAGYARGDLVAPVYPDTLVSLRRWHAQGHPIHVYSSGSAAAQRLFFAHTTAGDLTPLFSGHHDLSTGSKREAGSYQALAASIRRPPPEILFLSDVVEELDAAREAGLGTILVDRPADYPSPRIGATAHGHRRVESFAEIRV